MAPLAAGFTTAILLIIGLGLLIARRVVRMPTALAVMVIALVAGALAGLASGITPVLPMALTVTTVLIVGVGAVASVALLTRPY